MPLEEFVRRKVAAGDFQSVDEVVCEGLQLLQQEAWNTSARNKIDVGWAEAKSGELRTPEQVQDSLLARKDAWTRFKGP